MDRFVINGRFLSQRITGVQRYARELTRALANLGVSFDILAPPDANVDDFAKFTTIVGKRTGHAWEQFDLPAELRHRGSPLLVNLGSVAPVGYSNQIMTLHDVAYLRHPDSFSWKFRTLYRLAIPVMLRRIKLLTTVSEFSRAEIREAYGARIPSIEIIPNAVDQRFAGRDSNVPNKRFILAVSAIKKQKNFDRLLEAFRGLPASVDCDLYVVGATERAFSATGEQQPPDPRVKMLGYLDDAELIELYQGALAFAFPSLYEGFGIPPLEAQACGCPVIASDVPGVRETLGESALYFDPLDVSDIRAALSKVIENGKLREQLATNGFENIKRFSWQRSAELLLRSIATLNP